MVLRLATEDDLPFLLRLRNDPETREWSKTREEITAKANRDWWNKTTDRILIAEVDGEPVGTVRFVRHPHELEMGIVIAPEHRGKRLAAKMIEAGAKEAWHPVVAYVREDNDRSLRAFKRAGFKVDGMYMRFTYEKH